MSIRENDIVKVITTEPWFEAVKGMIGEVRAIHELGADNIAIVKFDDGSFAKLPLDGLVKVTLKGDLEAEAIPEGAKRITKADFEKALTESTIALMTGGDSMKYLLSSMTGTIVGSRIRDNLFKSEDVITLTEDQYIATIWDACSPESISNSIDNNMSVNRCIDVGVAAIIALKRTINILFGESEGD